MIQVVESAFTIAVNHHANANDVDGWGHDINAMTTGGEGSHTKEDCGTPAEQLVTPPKEVAVRCRFILR